MERIVCLQPELLRILMALGQQDKVVAVDRFPVRYDHLLAIIFPGVSRLPVVSVTGEDARVESILELEADLVAVSPSEFSLSRHLSRKLNCPVVSLSSSGKLDDLLAEIELLARVTGSESAVVIWPNICAPGWRKLRTGQKNPAGGKAPGLSQFLGLPSALSRQL